MAIHLARTKMGNSFRGIREASKKIVSSLGREKYNRMSQARQGNG
jgi:hypothetical protein